MKKTIITIAAIALAAFSAAAQSLSVGAGYQSYKFSTKTGDNDAVVSDPSKGFYAGADATLFNLGPVAVTPGIYFSYNTAETTASVGSLASGSSTLKEMYLGIPVNFSYGIDLGAAKIFAYAGPTFSLGCSSTTEVAASALGVGVSSDPIDNYDGDSYGKFDVLVGGGLGVDIKCIRISAGYNYGLLDRNSSDNVKLNRSGFHAGIAYLF